MYERNPELIWWNGSVVPWHQAQVHVTSETALRGLNVFEGIRGYWDAPGETLRLIQFDAHLRRLRDSADLLHIPAEGLVEQMRQGVKGLLIALDPHHDVYLRPTLYVDTGRYTQSAKVTTGLFVACHRTDPDRPEAVSCITSSWRHIPEPSLPPLAKTGAAYTAFRLARLEALRAGADEAILLNTRDQVTETPGAAVFAVRDGQILTPPLADGILGSLTRSAVIRLAQRDFDLTVAERSLTRTELHNADEVFLTGTLDEVRPVSSVDGHRRQRAAPIGPRLRTAYLEMCTGQREPLDDAFAEVLT
jgi:branched-chain amino acid aminotransferase